MHQLEFELYKRIVKELDSKAECEIEKIYREANRGYGNTEAFEIFECGFREYFNTWVFNEENFFRCDHNKLGIDLLEKAVAFAQKCVDLHRLAKHVWHYIKTGEKYIFWLRGGYLKSDGLQWE